MAGGFFATSVGNGHPLGVEGWRFAFFLIASVSVFTGILTLLMASDPRRVCPTLLPLCSCLVHSYCRTSSTIVLCSSAIHSHRKICVSLDSCLSVRTIHGLPYLNLMSGMARQRHCLCPRRADSGLIAA